MNDKDSTTLREQYGRKLAAHLCDQHFGARPTATLDGPAVLRFTPIRQVNLFVVQQLLAQWTQEMARLRSPYFDFEADDVRTALTQFMNVLSRRIKLSRSAFEPLLARAVADTLAATQDLAGTFEAKLLNGQPAATSTQLRDALRYLDINKPLFQGFLDTLPTDTPLERDTLLQQFRQHVASNTALQQPLSQIVAEFDALLPLREEDLQPSRSATAAPVAPMPAAPAPAAPIAAPAPAAAATAPEPVKPVLPAPPVPEVKPAVAAAPEKLQADAEAVVPLYQKLKASQPAGQTLSETLRSERPVGTLAEQAPKVESLREAISINQRFSFINELFEGENMAYHAAIQHLDTLPDADSAKRYVSEHLASKHDWARKDEHVNKLLKLIDRKFA
ncbi:hypothetical protein J0X19_07250 [Hymenobacter sp. BT186]|uniref:Uncharacterized protein n=1 Tax=Hymenobacter telluris TaxID=2816474 RepID=A0A939EV10_9BACT|nr:hypothetical protein [Hymenobacter telluris]MBO0357737.1 hypothetical protein [Hymenobacter telluris]MBW3373764.1 hypothetical protein [Hymenobacter norwichensis]